MCRVVTNFAKFLTGFKEHEICMVTRKELSAPLKKGIYRVNAFRRDLNLTSICLSKWYRSGTAF